jgi:hypothetical protein
MKSRNKPLQPLMLSEFIAEMHEIVREARETCAVDDKGQNIELYFGDMMRRLERAVDLVNARVVARERRNRQQAYIATVDNLGPTHAHRMRRAAGRRS